MNIKVIKALRELRIHPGRTTLAVFALALGIWGAGSVVISYYLMSRDLNTNFLQTLPPHLILQSDGFGQHDLDRILAHPEVASAELRDLTMQRVEIRPDVWVPLLLYGVDNMDSISLARVFPESGAVNPPPGSILLERDGQIISELETGSEAAIRIDGRILKVPVSGICFDPAQAPATQDRMIYAYCSRETFASLTGFSSGQRMILRFRNVTTLAEAQQKADALLQDLESAAIPVTDSRFPTFNEHPHQWQLNTLLFVIGSIGLLAFLMGAVLISQLMRAVMAGQVRQIGIMKSTGATQRQVLQIYVTMLLLLGLPAGMFAVPASVMTGKAFAAFTARILNFDILSSIPWCLVAAMFLTGLMLPLAVSLPLLLRGTGTSVLNALNDYGISGQFTRLRLKKSSQAASGTWLLAFRNSLRNGRRLLVAVFTMALGVAIFSTGFNVRQSLWNLLSGLKEELQYDVQVVLGSQVETDTAIAPFRGLANVKSMHTWNGGSGAAKSGLLATAKGAGIVALPWNTDLIRPPMIRGRWMRQASETEVVMNQQAWELYGFPEPGSVADLGVGDTVIRVTVVGVAEQFDLSKIYMDQLQYDAMFNQRHLVNTVTFVAQDRGFSEVIRLKQEIERAIASSDLDVLYVMSNAERVQVVYAHLNIILSTLLILSFLVLLVSAVGMASATGISIRERTREIGVMRAIGATPSRIYALLTREGIIVSAISILLGLLMAWPLSQAASVFFGRLMLGEQAILRYAFSPTGLVVTLCATLAFGWMASRIPAIRAVKRVSTREALAYE